MPDRVAARARALYDPAAYRSKLERDYAAHLFGMRLVGEIHAWRYEPFNIRLAKNTYYVVDFMVIANDGTIEFHETKGFSRATGRVKFKTAAELHPWFRWVWVTRERGGAWKREDYAT